MSSVVSEASWYLFTTRRILGIYGGQQYETSTTEVLDYHFGDFKGYGHEETTVMRLSLTGGRKVELEYETGRASMAPIYYMKFWRVKYPILDKLRFDPRQGMPVCPQCGKRLRTDQAEQCFHCGADWHGKTRPG